MVVELRDKVGLMPGAAAEDVVGRGAANLTDEATQALLSLGYSEADAALALQNIDPSLPTEERIKQALKGQMTIPNHKTKRRQSHTTNRFRSVAKQRQIRI